MSCSSSGCIRRKVLGDEPVAFSFSQGIVRLRPGFLQLPELCFDKSRQLRVRKIRISHLGGKHPSRAEEPGMDTVALATHLRRSLPEQAVSPVPIQELP